MDTILERLYMATDRPCVDSRNWRKSSYSMGGNGDCIEVSSAAGKVMVRDSKDRSGPLLAYPASTWREFLAEARERMLG